MQMAKPTNEQQQAVMDFLAGLEIIIEQGCIPKGEDDCGEDATGERVLEWLEEKWRTVGNCWHRVLWAGRTAIDSACDPNASVLEFKPEIRAAMERRTNG